MSPRPPQRDDRNGKRGDFLVTGTGDFTAFSSLTARLSDCLLRYPVTHKKENIQDTCWHRTVHSYLLWRRQMVILPPEFILSMTAHFHHCRWEAVWERQSGNRRSALV